MTVKGIRILDKIDGVVNVDLKDILDEVRNGDQFYWSLLYFYGAANLKNGKDSMEFDAEVLSSEKGIFFKWSELKEFASSLIDLWGIVIIGCKDQQLIQRYKIRKEMYEAYDVVIEEIDSSFWEVFSKDLTFIDRLASKFKDVKFLESDHLEKQ